MKARWFVNLILLVLILGVAAFIYTRPRTEAKVSQSYEISTLKLADINRASVEQPTKAPVVFEKIDGYWYVAQPYKARADQMMVNRMLSIVAAKSSDKFPADDLARFGLDKPRLKLKLGDDEFLFGTFNPVTEAQYVVYKDAVYMLPVSYSESAQVQLTEFLDKSPMKPSEKIVGFDFSHLEQWEETRLNVDMVNGKWTATAPKAKIDQNEMNEWFDSYWTHMSVQSVEPYTPDRKATLPSFEVKLKDGSKVHFDKLQESPQLLLGRPDEGMLYHITQDIGFTLVNPPVGIVP